MENRLPATPTQPPPPLCEPRGGSSPLIRISLLSRDFLHVSFLLVRSESATVVIVEEPAQLLLRVGQHTAAAPATSPPTTSHHSPAAATRSARSESSAGDATRDEVPGQWWESTHRGRGRCSQTADYFGCASGDPLAARRRRRRLGRPALTRPRRRGEVARAHPRRASVMLSALEDPARSSPSYGRFCLPTMSGGGRKGSTDGPS